MKLENFYVVGINHSELEIDEREEFLKKKPLELIKKLVEGNKVYGFIDLSTCLRVEYYLHIKDKNFRVEDIFKGEKGIFIRKGEEALEHLFRVICGFESVIKGEDQILAQGKRSHTRSLEENYSSPVLNIIFNRAIEVGKRFRSESKIAENALSLEAISLKFIKNSVKDLENKKVLILGTGELALDILYLLKKNGVEDITITNRSKIRAIEVREEFDIKLINFEDKNRGVVESDVVISITSAPHYILKYEELIDRLVYKKKKVMLDLAVPRDIDRRIGEIEGVELYNLDNVWEVYNKNKDNREGKLEEYYYLLEKQKEVVKKWFYYKNRLIEELGN